MDKKLVPNTEVLVVSQVLNTAERERHYRGYDHLHALDVFNMLKARGKQHNQVTEMPDREVVLFTIQRGSEVRHLWYRYNRKNLGVE